MRVEVTQEDIDNGRPGIPGLCALALAMSRHLAAGEQAIVGPYMAFVRKDEKYIRSYLLSPAAVEFVRNFDYRQPVKPQAFELREHP